VHIKDIEDSVEVQDETYLRKSAKATDPAHTCMHAITTRVYEIAKAQEKASMRPSLRCVEVENHAHFQFKTTDNDK
jgi:hypothetical protein